jgi:hypothetical protein
MCSVSRRYDGMTDELQRFARKWSWPNGGTVPAFVWKDWGKQQKTSVTTAGITAEIWPHQLPNTSLEHYLQTSLPGNNLLILINTINSATCIEQLKEGDLFQGWKQNVFRYFTMELTVFINLAVGWEPLVLRPKVGPSYKFWMTQERMDQWWNDNFDGKTDILRWKSAPVLFCPPKIPHGLPWDWTIVSTVRSCWLTT